jgi:hypothetical protein
LWQLREMGSRGCGDSKLGQVSMAIERGGFKCLWQFKELGSICYGNLEVGSSGCGESIKRERT